MAVIADFILASSEDGVLVISMTPPTAIGGWTLVYSQSLRAEGIPFITKSVASGYSAASGITVTNSGEGVFQVNFFAPEMSGYSDGAYYYSISRTDSGYRTIVAEGYRLAPP